MAVWAAEASVTEVGPREGVEGQSAAWAAEAVLEEAAVVWEVDSAAWAAEQRECSWRPGRRIQASKARHPA